MGKICVKCTKNQDMSLGKTYVTIEGSDYCPLCAEELITGLITNIPVTTTESIDGFRVKRYIDIESVEVVVGTGTAGEMNSEPAFSDYFATRSSLFEQKLQKCKEVAIKKLKYKAYLKNANAIVGIDLDYTELSGSRIGLIVNGTLVELEKA